eukprot:GHVR01147879.1.p1 GENE.GHVR01147879.1~~GHVR01147879.1.p1  ORF type:complete len:166 (+),score=66.52 GHVR01147879.1:15-512(+)
MGYKRRGGDGGRGGRSFKRPRGNYVQRQNDDDGNNISVKRQPVGLVGRRMYALVFGYVGTGYHGLQKQTRPDGVHIPTIEGELHRAIAQYGSIDANDNTTRLSRAARTDKGVHAAMNVISLELSLWDREALATHTHILTHTHTETDHNGSIDAHTHTHTHTLKLT